MKVGQLKVIEKGSTRVLTSEQLAESFGTDIGKIRYNYSYNKARYVEGKHFFALKGEERSAFLNECEIHTSLKHAHTIYLWTEKGAFLHAKSLNTDKAWNAYSDLVDDYFAKVEQIKMAQIPTEIPNTIEDVLLLAIGSMKDMKFEISELKKSNRNLSLVVDNEIWITDHQKSDIQQAVNKRVGKLKKEAIDAHFQGVYGDLKTFFNVPKYDKIARKDFEQAIEFINGWFPKKKENSL